MPPHEQGIPKWKPLADCVDNDNSPMGCGIVHKAPAHEPAGERFGGQPPLAAELRPEMEPHPPRTTPAGVFRSATAEGGS